MRGIVVGIAATGVVGLVAVAVLVAAAVLALIGFRTPLTLVRRVTRSYEMWLAFLVAAFATTGSLFFSEVANFVPCEICWYQRYCMYPLAPLLLIVAARDAWWLARWVLPIPVIGAGLSLYHVLIEQGLAPQFTACLQSLPGGCALKWINEFGFVTIPTLALIAFSLLTAILLLAVTPEAPGQRR